MKSLIKALLYTAILALSSHMFSMDDCSVSLLAVSVPSGESGGRLQEGPPSLVGGCDLIGDSRGEQVPFDDSSLCPALPICEAVAGIGAVTLSKSIVMQKDDVFPVAYPKWSPNDYIKYNKLLYEYYNYTALLLTKKLTKEEEEYFEMLSQKFNEMQKEKDRLLFVVAGSQSVFSPAAINYTIGVLIKAGTSPDYGESSLHFSDISGLLRDLTPTILAINKKFYRQEVGGILPVLDQNGEFPLSVAVKAGNLEVVNYLLGLGAYINKQDINGNTPVMSAVLLKPDTPICKNEIFLALINHKRYGVSRPSLSMQNEEGQTVLMMAAERNDVASIEMLIRMCPPQAVNFVDKDGNSAFMLALKRNNLGVATLILKESECSFRYIKNKDKLVEIINKLEASQDKEIIVNGLISRGIIKLSEGRLSACSNEEEREKEVAECFDSISDVFIDCDVELSILGLSRYKDRINPKTRLFFGKEKVEISCDNIAFSYVNINNKLNKALNDVLVSEESKLILRRILLRVNDAFLEILNKLTDSKKQVQLLNAFERAKIEMLSREVSLPISTKPSECDKRMELDDSTITGATLAALIAATVSSTSSFSVQAAEAKKLQMQRELQKQKELGAKQKFQERLYRLDVEEHSDPSAPAATGSSKMVHTRPTERKKECAGDGQVAPTVFKRRR